MLGKLFDLVFDVADKALDITLDTAELAFDTATSDKACELYDKAFDATCALLGRF